MKTKLILFLIFILLAVGIFFWAYTKRTSDEKLLEEETIALENDGELAGREPGTSPVPGMACLEDHLFAERHIHTWLAIVVDGERQEVPTDIGVTDDCMLEVHTHDPDGWIHLESVEPDRKFTLQDFFVVWGQKIEKDGYELKMQVNKQPSVELGNLILKNKDEVILWYTKK